MKNVNSFWVFMLFLSTTCLDAQNSFEKKLPDWFFNPPQSSKETSYAIGISDPGLKLDIARQQSIQRAIAVNDVLMGCYVQGSREMLYITSEGSRDSETNSESFTEVVFKSSQSISYELVEEYLSAYDEVISLLRIRASETENEETILRRGLVNSSFSHNEKKTSQEIEETASVGFTYMFETPRYEEYCKFKHKVLNKEVERSLNYILTFQNQDPIKCAYSQKSYTYFNSNLQEKLEETNGIIYGRTDVAVYGLWWAYFNLIIENIELAMSADIRNEVEERRRKSVFSSDKQFIKTDLIGMQIENTDELGCYLKMYVKVH